MPKYDAAAVRFFTTCGRISGSLAKNSIHIQNATRPAADTSSGTSVRQWFHGYWTPPQVTGIRKPVSDDVKRNIPTQSTRRSFERKEEVLK